eukprot:jgi/Tetstr1/428435/TSEL_018449.t1
MVDAAASPREAAALAKKRDGPAAAEEREGAPGTTPTGAASSLRQRRNFRGDSISIPPEEDSGDGNAHGGGGNGDGGIQMLTPARVADISAREQGRTAAAGTALLYLLLAVLVMWVVQWAPRPGGLNAPLAEFSEGRAMRHVEVLAAGIGHRQVSTASLARARDYLHRQLLGLQADADAVGGVAVEVDLQTANGAVNMVFCHEAITNVYHNLSNLALRITPHGTEGLPAVLVASHYDSTIGSAGASDAASMIGIMLEAARLVIDSDAARPMTPLIFLFNGGEETLSQAAHGFAAHHPWAKSIGAFINLESGGPHGLDVMFQSTGDWTSQAYARAAVYPRGNVMAQDIFLTGLIPADTDFRMFSAQHYGWLPGIDIAFVLGAHQYHTLQDTLQNIPPGTLQVMGENAVAALREFSYELRFNAEGVAATDNLRRGQVYYDVLSMFMVTYDSQTAAWLHRAPLVAAGALLAGTVGHLGGVHALVTEAALCGASFVGAVAAPSLLGAARVLLSGVPLAWFGRWWLAFLIYVPAAVVGALAPRVLLASRGRNTGDASVGLQAGVCGSALLASGLSWAASSYDIGSGYIFFLWASALLLTAAAALVMRGNWEGQLVAALGLSAFPALLSLQIGCVWLIHVWQKISMGGALDSPVGVIVSDYAAGLLTGAVTWLALLGALPALTMHRPTARRIVLGCSAIAIAAALMASTFAPYSEQAPKRALLQHYHVHDHLGRVTQSSWVIAAMDSVPVQTLLTHPHITGAPMPGTGLEWLSFHPLGKILQTVVLDGPPPDPKHMAGSSFPQLRKQSLTRGVDGRVRLELCVVLPEPGWGVLNITAPILDWSLTSDMPSPSAAPATPKGAPTYIVRFAGDEGSQHWSFWLELPASASGTRLNIKMAVMFMESTRVLEAFIATLPAYASPVPVTTYASSWSFPLIG